MAPCPRYRAEWRDSNSSGEVDWEEAEERGLGVVPRERRGGAAGVERVRRLATPVAVVGRSSRLDVTPSIVDNDDDDDAKPCGNALDIAFMLLAIAVVERLSGRTSSNQRNKVANGSRQS